MINVSNAFITALRAGAPQRWLFAWADGTLTSNEDISVEDGVSYDETFCSETDLTVGLTPSSQMSFVLLNGDLRWVDFAFGWFTASLGVRIAVEQDGSSPTRHPVLTVSGTTLTVSGNGTLETYELCPFGTFFADRPAVVRKYLIDITANDRMLLFDQDMPSDVALGITYPVTAAALLTAMCNYLNVPVDLTTFTINSGMTLASRPEAFEGASMRDVLGMIAEVGCSIARFNRSGVLCMKWLNRLIRSFDEHDYTEFERTEYQTVAVDKLSVRNADSTSESVIGTGDSPYMILDNPFLNQTVEGGT